MVESSKEDIEKTVFSKHQYCRYILKQGLVWKQDNIKENQPHSDKRGVNASALYIIQSN